MPFRSVPFENGKDQGTVQATSTLSFDQALVHFYGS